ncbi:MAG: hypothetical protein GX610_14335 [Rhodococcus sp.]|nr:hypothetical protein [Rhodococcus sp. (in: high G+C Gram-positive bacteria)]
MAEFRADPAYVAGLGNAVGEIGRDNQRIAAFIGEHGAPGEFYSGPIIAALMNPLKEFAEAAEARMLDIADVNIWTSVELNKAAWMYYDQEAQNYAALNAHTGHLGGDSYASGPATEMQGITEGYGGAESFPKPEEIKLDPPAANKEDLAALISEASGWLGDVNEAIKNSTRMAGMEWDALGSVLSPITGNWNELVRIGESHKIAGNAFEVSARNMADGMRRVSDEWDGKAAASFDEHAGRQREAMAWEGPVGRTVAVGLGMAAERIRQAIITVISKLEELLESQVSFDGVLDTVKFWAKKIPVVGTTAQMAALGRIIWKVADMVLALVDEIREMVDRIKEFLSAVTNPIGKAHGKLDDRLSPITSKIDDYTRRTAFTEDLKKVNNYDSTFNRPKEAFEVGAGKDPWADG